MRISIKRVEELEIFCFRCSTSSIDVPCGEDEGCTVGDLLTGIEGIENDVVDNIFRQQVYSELWEKVDTLEDNQAAVIKERYQHDRTQEETSEALGVNRERVRQLHSKAIRNYHFHTTWTSSTEHAALQLLEEFY